MMRILLMALWMMLSSLSVNAEDFTYLTFQTKDGTEYSLAVSGLSITFIDGNMVASDGTTLPLSNLNKMYFTSTSDIAKLKREGTAGTVLVFNGAGIQIGTYSTLSEALSVLGKGLYVIKKSNGETDKVTVK